MGAREEVRPSLATWGAWNVERRQGLETLRDLDSAKHEDTWISPSDQQPTTSTKPKTKRMGWGHLGTFQGSPILSRPTLGIRAVTCRAQSERQIVVHVLREDQLHRLFTSHV